MHRPHPQAIRAAEQIAAETGVPAHDVAVVFGSGWGGARDFLGPAVAEVPAASLDGFFAPGVPGHHGEVQSFRTVSGLRILALGARRHFYEGRDAHEVAHPVRTAAATGCRILVLTNGCGSSDRERGPGTPVLIADHLNLTGATPLAGPSFVDMTDAYSPALRGLARRIDPSLTEAVYAQFAGPQYETPSEVRMATMLGATLVGMSTALEAIAAREAGMEVLGLSLVTNLAAGVSGEKLSHSEVVAAGEAAAPRIGRLLADILAALPA